MYSYHKNMLNVLVIDSAMIYNCTFMSPAEQETIFLHRFNNQFSQSLVTWFRNSFHTRNAAQTFTGETTPTTMPRFIALS